MDEIGKALLALGVALIGAGAALVAGGRLGLGRLPGDLRWETEGLRVHVPLATCLLVSLGATVLLNLFLRR